MGRRAYIVVAFLAAMLARCATPTRPATVTATAAPTTTVVEVFREDPVIFERRRAAQAAADRARCEAERASVLREQEEMAATHAALPHEVLVAFARAEPLVFAGLDDPDWPARWADYVRFVQWMASPITPFPVRQRAAILVTSLWHQLLMRDADLARARVSLADLRRCISSSGRCEHCRSLHGHSNLSSTNRDERLPTVVALLDDFPVETLDDPRVELIRAWALPPDRTIAALDLLAGRGASRPYIRRGAILLAARAALEGGDVDGAMARLRPLSSTTGPDSDPAADVLMGVCHLVAGRTHEARRLLRRASTSRRLDGSVAEAARMILAANSP